jgi:monofunctional glycosyltransferase
MHTVFRFLRQLLLTVLLLALLVLVAAGGYFAVTGHKLYESAIQVTPLDTLYSSISSREGFVPYAQLPQTYINAVISAEDSRFTHHKGVDPVSIARALVTDLRTGSFAEHHHPAAGQEHPVHAGKASGPQGGGDVRRPRH